MAKRPLKIGTYVRIRHNPQVHGFVARFSLSIYGIMAEVLCDGIAYKVPTKELIRTRKRTPEAQDYDVMPQFR